MDGDIPLVYLELTVTKTQLERRYCIPRGDGQAMHSLPPSADWEAIEVTLARWNKGGGSVLEGGRFGDALFQALFGPSEQGSAERIAAEAWQRRPDHPRHRPLQLRIVTDNPLLAGLPWHEARCAGGLLRKDGWSFALAAASDPRPSDLSCRLPGRVLAFIPDGVDRSQQAALQHRRIDACLQNLWSDQPKRHALHCERIGQWPPAQSSGDAPCLLYVETRARLWRHRLELCNGDGAWIKLAELSQAAGRPAVIVLNLAFGDDLCAPLEVTWSADDCALVIIQRHIPSERDDAEERALQWLRAMMIGEHPIMAAHRHLLATSNVLAAFRHWRPVYHDGPPLLSNPERARLRLDRHRQRREIEYEVARMVDRPESRLVAAFAYGVDGNQPDLFAGQILESLLAPRLRLQIQSRIVHLLDGDPVTGDSLSVAFYAALQADVEHVSLQQALSAKRPQRRPGYETLLLFHWRRGDGAGGWNAEARKAWECFCRETLADACPPDLNILALLPLAIGGKQELGALSRQINTLRRLDPQRTNYHLLRLPPLSTVDVEEVREFLVDEMDAAYPKTLLDHLPGLILRAASDGKSDEAASFEPTAKVLQRGFDQDWTTLEQELRRRWPSSA